jgi:Zn-dependent peptidase ImmA (M78 family)
MTAQPRSRRVSPSAAEKVLAEYNVQNAPVPVDRIAKLMGAQLRFTPLDKELSGMVFIKDGNPIIGVNSLHHPNRQRFTIAHEIGHLVLHKQHLSSAVHVDKDFKLFRGAKASEGTDPMEVAANNFGSELLVPRQFLDPFLDELHVDMDDEKPLEELAQKFRVSKQVLSYRIQNLSRG